MNDPKRPLVKTIKKQHVEAAILFAIDNIPGIDEDTLQKFLEFVNVTGNFGSISQEELLEKMRLIRKYIPGSCGYSLLTLAELLEMDLPVSTGGRDVTMIVGKNEATAISRPGYFETIISVSR